MPAEKHRRNSVVILSAATSKTANHHMFSQHDGEIQAPSMGNNE
jgi:hypothetical protein